MDVAFRRATRSDSPVALEVVDRARRDYGLFAVPESTDADVTDVEAHHDARGGCLELT